MIYFKIGCYVLITTCFIHLLGHFQEPIPENESEKQMLDLMINYKMNIGSDTITMMGLQKGFSLCFSLLFLWTGVMGLFLAKALTTSTAILRKISFIYAGALTVETTISLVYFFMAPTVCLAVALVFFSIAAIRLK